VELLNTVIISIIYVKPVFFACHLFWKFCDLGAFIHVPYIISLMQPNTRVTGNGSFVSKCKQNVSLQNENLVLTSALEDDMVTATAVISNQENRAVLLP